MNIQFDDFLSADDETTESCVPSSLTVFIDCVKVIGEMVHERVRISTVYIKRISHSPDAEYSRMAYDTFLVTIGYHVKKDWYSISIEREYYYAHGACSNARTNRVVIKKQTGNELVEQLNKSYKQACTNIIEL